MRITWAHLWTGTLCANTLIWIFCPPVRSTISLILIMHIPVLIWGISDIRSQFFGEVLFRQQEDNNQIAITFDDGPDPRLTPQLLSLLQKFSFKATFFIIAQKAQLFPEIVRDCYMAGHTIACHDFSHDITSNFRFHKRMRYELQMSQRIITEIIGKTPAIYRPPSGLMNPHVLPVCTSLGMTCVGWSRSASEGGNRLKSRFSRIASLAGAGEIILMHDSLPIPEYRETLLRSMEILFTDIASRKLSAVTIDVFFNIKPYGEQIEKT